LFIVYTKNHETIFYHTGFFVTDAGIGPAACDTGTDAISTADERKQVA
jgi:hypothetical protein